MMSMSGARCDCCGLPLSPQLGEDCPRCGYPIAIFKEEQFLIASLRDLRRVADHGGANTTVTQLMRHYQNRLNWLRRVQQAPVPFAAAQPVAPVSQTEKVQVPVQPIPPQPPIEMQAPAQQERVVVKPSVPPVTVRVRPVHEAPARVFSLKAFFADQTINIVVSLAAFLILIGTLGYVATNSNLSNLFLSFTVMFIAHAIFGLIGTLAYWFRSRLSSLRIIAAVYTAIFALLVPLVGFSGYRLVAGHIVELSPSALVAIAAVYAAIVYGALAVYQKFAPFGYLSVVAQTVAILAVASAFNLGYWWWPSVLMVPAFLAILSLPDRLGAAPFTGTWAILREPVRALMFACVGVCGTGAILTYLYSLGLALAHQVQSEVRFSLLCALPLLFVWVCLFVWHTQRVQWAQSIPYLFLTSALAFAYAFEFRQVGYVLMLTAVAVFFHSLTLLVPQFLLRYGRSDLHLEGLSLALVAIVPFIAVPLLPVEVLLRAYAPFFHVVSLNWEMLAEIIALLVGVALTLSVVLRHTGWQRTPETSQKQWLWLLLLSGFLLNWVYGLVGLTLTLEPVWWFLALTLVLVACAVAVRRFVGPAWANPVDVLALIETAVTIGLGLGNVDRSISLLFCFAALSYGVLLYQRRQSWLFLPLILMLLTSPFLLLRVRVLLVACIVLPFVAAIIRHFITDRWNVVRVSDQAEARPGSVLPWEWPLVVSGILYGLIFTASDSFVSTSVVQGWLSIKFSFALEMAVLAVIWYGAATLARVKWWLIVTMVFAVIGLLVPTNPFWVLAWLAPLLALLALGVSRLTSKGWAIPIYGIALFAAIMMGLAGYNQQEIPAATWALLLFALLIYLIGVVEDTQILMWVAPFFAIWSVYDSGLLGDLYRPPLVALVCAALGGGVSALRFIRGNEAIATWQQKLLHYALPIYATALAAAVLTGVYGTLQGVNHPFYAAIPDALLLYALVAYGILLLERRAVWQWLVAGLAGWGIILTLQTTAATCLQLLSIRSFPGSVASACSVQVQATTWYLVGIAFGSAILGMLAGRFIRYPIKAGLVYSELQTKFAWSWSWYAAALVAIIVTVLWSDGASAFLPNGLELNVLGALIGLSLLVMLVERVPELLTVTAVLALWSITRTHWPLWQQMMAYSVLWMLVFASQFLWKMLTPAVRLLAPMRLYSLLSIGGQILVVLAIILQGGLFADAGLLAHVGAGSLFVLAVLLFWYGYIQPDSSSRPWLYYSAGLLLSLVVSWELAAFRQTQADRLTLAPASYLIIIAPFIARDQRLSRHSMAGQVCAIAGATLLLLPMLWLSFGQDNLQPTLILAGESLILLILGVATHQRFFVLGGAGLIIVSAIHVLFLPSLGIPFFLAIIMAGLLLLGIATGLTLARHRLPSLWSQSEP